MKKLKVPHTSLREVKSDPLKVFKQAEEEKSGVYVLDHNNVAGVIMSENHYESLIRRIEHLEGENLELIAAARLQDTEITTYTDEEVRGDLANRDMATDEIDEWE